MQQLQVLLIGIDRYGPSPMVRDLYGAVADVDAMQAYLLRCQVPRENIRRLVSSHQEARNRPETLPTYEVMVAGILDLAGRARNTSAEVLVYFSGHGGQVETLIPSTKGEDGLDEGLVPWNLHQPGARFLRDVELTFWLDSMARDGIPATLIIDACHSGGLMRKPASGIRRRRASGVWREPGASPILAASPSLVAPVTELKRVWRRVHHRAQVPLRHSRRNTSGWTSRGVLQGCGVGILAACHSNGAAFERDFGDGPRGTFTHCLLEMLSRGVPPESWDDAHRRLVRRMRQFPSPQWPVFEGVPSPTLFSCLRVCRERGIAVVEVDRRRGRVLLDAGLACGLRGGALLEIRSLLGSGEDSKALVEVDEAAAGESWARVVDPGEDSAVFEPGGLRPGDVAVLVDPGERRRRVAWVGSLRLQDSAKVFRGRRSEAGEFSGESTMSAVRAEVVRRGGSWLEWAPPDGSGPPADILLAAKDGRIEILDGSDVRVPGVSAGGGGVRVPGVSAGGGRGLVRRVVERLIHLARFHRVKDLANRDERSELCDGLGMRLGVLPVGHTPGDPLVAEPVDRSGRVEVSAGRWILLQIDNRSRRTLFLQVLDLRPDWSIEIIHPESGLQALEGRRQISLPFEIFLPPRHAGGRETLKCIATAEPVRLGALCLPSIWHATTGVKKVGGSRPGELFQDGLAGSGGKVWRSARFRRANDLWTSAQVDFEVVPPMSRSSSR